MTWVSPHPATRLVDLLFPPAAPAETPRSQTSAQARKNAAAASLGGPEVVATLQSAGPDDVCAVLRRWDLTPTQLDVAVERAASTSPDVDVIAATLRAFIRTYEPLQGVPVGAWIFHAAEHHVVEHVLALIEPFVPGLAAVPVRADDQRWRTLAALIATRDTRTTIGQIAMTADLHTVLRVLYAHEAHVHDTQEWYPASPPYSRVAVEVAEETRRFAAARAQDVPVSQVPSALRAAQDAFDVVQAASIEYGFEVHQHSSRVTGVMDTTTRLHDLVVEAETYDPGPQTYVALSEAAGSDVSVQLRIWTCLDRALGDVSLPPILTKSHVPLELVFLAVNPARRDRWLLELAALQPDRASDLLAVVPVSGRCAAQLPPTFVSDLLHPHTASALLTELGHALDDDPTAAPLFAALAAGNPAVPIRTLLDRVVATL